MTDRRRDRENKLQLLNEGKLNPKQRADFCYKMAKIIENDLDKLKEIPALLESTPDSYLKEIDFKDAAKFAMRLTELLIEKSKPANIGQELLDGSWHSHRVYTIELGNILPGIRNSTIELEVSYRPTSDELRFNRLRHDHATSTTRITLEHGRYSFKDFTNKVLPSLKAKDAGLHIKNRGIMGYKPLEEFNDTGMPKEVDPRLLDAVRKVTKELGTDMRAGLHVVPYELTEGPK